MMMKMNRQKGMGEIKYLSTPDALACLEKRGYIICTATLLNWVKKYGLGHQLFANGPWKIDKEKLFAFINNKKKED